MYIGRNKKIFSEFGKKGKRRKKQRGTSLKVQMKGLEPTRYCYHQNLNLARLPIPPHLQNLNRLIIRRFQIFVNRKPSL